MSPVPHRRMYQNIPQDFSSAPAVGDAAPTVAAGAVEAPWLAPHFGQNEALPISCPHAEQNAIAPPPYLQMRGSVTKVPAVKQSKFQRGSRVALRRNVNKNSMSFCLT